jgi:hypothetical protein
MWIEKKKWTRSKEGALEKIDGKDPFVARSGF